MNITQYFQTISRRIVSTLWNWFRSIRLAVLPPTNQKEKDLKIFVDKLFVYPVKSCAGISVDSAKLVETGFEFDRQWLVINEETKKFVTQRQYPRMALIKPKLILNEKQGDGLLELEAPGMETKLQVPISNSNLNSDKYMVTVWSDEIAGYDCGKEAADWLSQYIGINVRLVVKDPQFRRPLDPEFVKQNDYQYSTQTGFADGYPLLVVTTASIKDIKSKLNAINPTYNISERNFRPNIVLKSESETIEPFEEDKWSGMRIAGGVEIKLVEKCSRCSMPNVDTDAGVMAMPTLKTLMTYRREKLGEKLSNRPYLAVNAVHTRLGGVVKIGEAVTVFYKEKIFKMKKSLVADYHSSDSDSDSGSEVKVLNNNYDNTTLNINSNEKKEKEVANKKAANSNSLSNNNTKRKLFILDTSILQESDPDEDIKQSALDDYNMDRNQIAIGEYPSIAYPQFDYQAHNLYNNNKSNPKTGQDEKQYVEISQRDQLYLTQEQQAYALELRAKDQIKSAKQLPTTTLSDNQRRKHNVQWLISEAKLNNEQLQEKYAEERFKRAQKRARYG